MKFVNGPKKTYNFLIMLMNLNQMEKLKCFNHTCKRMFKLKIPPTKTLIPDQMKMKFGQQQTYKSLMIKNPNQMLNPTLILNQMIAPKRLKIFNLMLPTSQTDSHKTLTISSSDLWSEPMPSKDKPAMVKAAIPMVISSLMKHLPNRPPRKFLPPIRVLREVSSELISANIGKKHGDTSMSTVLVQLESSESHNSWDSWHPTNTCLLVSPADQINS